MCLSHFVLDECTLNIRSCIDAFPYREISKHSLLPAFMKTPDQPAPSDLRWWTTGSFYEDWLKRFIYAVHHGLLGSELLHLPGCVKWADSGLGHQMYSLQSFDLRNQWLVLLNKVVYFFGILLSSLVLWSSQFFVLSSLRSEVKCYFFLL